MSAVLDAKTLLGSQYSTYKVGGPMVEAYQPETREQALSLLSNIALTEKNLTVIGWGGNVIIASAGISGITLITRKMTWVEEISPSAGEEGAITSLRFGAGVHLAKASKAALDHGLTGGEFMIGIPGTIGGAIRMNAGALGQEMKDIVTEALVFDRQAPSPQEALSVWDHSKLVFAYRKSAIDPNRYLVIEATCRFQPGDPKLVQAAMDENVHFRRTHHPVEPSGGSVFRNPYPKESPNAHLTAGRMLDELGAKGWQEGGVMVSPTHANFIVNINQGTSTDILRLMVRMQQAVKAHYHVTLHPENLLIGDATPEEASLWEILQTP